MDRAEAADSAGVLERLRRAVGACEAVDLSVTLENDLPRWPTHPPLVVHPTLTHERDGHFSNTLFLAEHIGTHCDAPAHVRADLAAQTVETLAVDRLIGPAAVIDLSPRRLEAGETVGPEAILAWEAAHGPIAPGEIVLITSGWWTWPAPTSMRWSRST